MKKHSAFLFVFALLLLSLSCVQQSPNANAPATTSTSSSPSSKKLTIAMIPKGTTHEFWRTVHAGAVKAARELSTPESEIVLIWKGPLKEDDREQQIQVVEGFTSQGVNGIVLAPLDNRALVRPVEEAKAAGIPTVIFDSGLESENIVSYVATDNRKGGMLAADRIGEVLNGKGKVLMLRYAEGSASTIEREAGFVDQLKAKHPGIELISSDQYAGPTRDTAKRTSENLLNRYVNELQGIFTVNENSTAGMQLALQDIGKAGKIPFVGFDSSAPFIEGLRNGQMQGFVVQNPFNMGYLAIKTMVDHLRGQPVERQIDTGVSIITPDNLDTPEVKERLNPPVSQYLN